MRPQSQALFEIPRDQVLPRSTHRGLLVIGLGLLAAVLDLGTGTGLLGAEWPHPQPHVAIDRQLGARSASAEHTPGPGDWRALSIVLIYVSMAMAFDLLLARRRHPLAQWFAPGALFGLIAYLLVFRLLGAGAGFPGHRQPVAGVGGDLRVAHMLVIGPLLAWGLTRGDTQVLKDGHLADHSSGNQPAPAAWCRFQP
jgi:hypothetical protein